MGSEVPLWCRHCNCINYSFCSKTRFTCSEMQGLPNNCTIIHTRLAWSTAESRALCLWPLRQQENMCKMQTDSHDTHTPLNTSRSSHILGIKTKLSTAYQIPRGELQPDTAHAGPSVTTQSACVCSVPQSCPTLCDPVDCSPLGSSVHGIFLAIILEEVAISFFRGSSQARDHIHTSHISYTGR